MILVWYTTGSRRFPRSRNLPLTLHIKLAKFTAGSKKVEKQLFDVFEVMSRYPNEWRSLSLEIPYSLFHTFHDSVSDFQSHLLTVKRLGIRCTDDRDDIDQPVPPSNAEMNPEKIEIYGLSFESLQCLPLFIKEIGRAHV